MNIFQRVRMWLGDSKKAFRITMSKHPQRERLVRSQVELILQDGKRRSIQQIRKKVAETSQARVSMREVRVALEALEKSKAAIKVTVSTSRGHEYFWEKNVPYSPELPLLRIAR